MSVPSRPRHRVVIMQPYFLPYRSYFGLIRRCDEFVIYDDVQFCRNWQRRNAIPDGKGGKTWLSIPVISRRPSRQRICDVEMMDDARWRQEMLQIVRQVYDAHPYFEAIYPAFERILLTDYTRLLDLTVALMQWATTTMGLRAPIWRFSSELGVSAPDRTRRLLEICQSLGATDYISGPASKVYFRGELFEAAGIGMFWHEETYRPYLQRATSAFDHGVSVLDLLMNHGHGSHPYLLPLEPDPARPEDAMTAVVAAAAPSPHA